MTDCKTCELISRRDAKNVPLWGCIYRTQFWDVVHHNGTTLPGWLVLVVRRHMGAIDELTNEEAIELGILLRQVSLALKETTGCIKTYAVQFAEMAGHQHVHFYIIPRMADQPENRRGTNVFEYSGVSEEERVSEETMNEIAMKVQKILLSSLSTSLFSVF
ncbi:MAG: HIT family protein [Anaerolineales bacterium]|nr:HIT family protein [Anaerolineales bacterium]